MNPHLSLEQAGVVKLRINCHLGSFTRRHGSLGEAQAGVFKLWISILVVLKAWLNGRSNNEYEVQALVWEANLVNRSVLVTLRLK